MEDYGVTYDAAGANSARTNTIEIGANDDYEFSGNNIQSLFPQMLSFSFDAVPAFDVVSGYVDGKQYQLISD